MSDIKALAFDVGGSVFDWKGAVKRAIAPLAKDHAADIDTEQFAMDWRLGMFMTLGRLHRGEIAHCNMDDMLHLALEEVLTKYPVLSLNEVEKAELMSAWHLMDAWDEFPRALDRMKSRYTVAILSVLSFAILVDS